MQLVKPSEAHRCRVCRAPLVELLSDAAGRVFGCPRCRSVDPGNARPPADVVNVHRYTRRERRRAARSWKRNRWGRRRVPRVVEETRARLDRVVVMRADVLAHLGAVTRELADGWALGVMTRETWKPPFRFFKTGPLAEWDERGARITETVIRFQDVGGMVWGAADETAPAHLVMAAFERLWCERAYQCSRAFLQEARSR